MLASVITTACDDALGLQLRKFAADGNAREVLKLLKSPALTERIINAQGLTTGKTALHRALEGLLSVECSSERYNMFFGRLPGDPIALAINKHILHGESSHLLEGVAAEEIKLKSYAVIMAAFLGKEARRNIPDSVGTTAEGLIARFLALRSLPKIYLAVDMTQVEFVPSPGL